MANPNTRSPWEKAFTFVDLSSIPGPRGWEYLYSYNFHFRRDILGAFTRVYQEYGDIASFPWPMNSIIIYSPELIRKVLVDDGKKYIKGEQLEELRAVLGQGLATNNDHASWLRSRSIVSREFGPRAVSKFAGVFDGISQRRIEAWKPGKLNVSEEMKFLTFEIASQSLLKANLSEEHARVVNEAVTYTSKVMYERIFKFFPVPYSIPIRTNRLFNQHYENLNRIVLGLIHDAKAMGPSENSTSVLERLVHAVDDEGKGLSVNELRDEVLTLLIAGNETSAHALMWTLGLLAKHPEIQEALYREIANTSESPENFFTAIPLLRNVILESMRIYPPFPVLSRKAAQDVELGAYKIPKNTNVVIPIYVTQRSEANWKNALEFEPQRPTKTDFDKSFAFFPFSRGTRKCVAEQFSNTEMGIVLFNVLRKFRLEMVESDLPEDEAFISLKPKWDIVLNLIER